MKLYILVCEFYTFGGSQRRSSRVGLLSISDYPTKFEMLKEAMGQFAESKGIAMEDLIVINFILMNNQI